ncbi:uncharacterized protein TNCV_3614771 [Trichonephila clavipes]|uniref:EGF-like domain-containing protein n=1 Tax=Trichonephila clavipes TaxID=2585209 RepID=A0A8X6VNE5_TRICX|nr:uncharacterized protein TNCV_3614771 [Trichonephila clavipes]
MTISRIWNRWVQDGNTERHAGSQWAFITSSQEDSRVTLKALMDHAATSRALDESRLCLQHQDCRIRVWWHRDERTLAACIRHRRTGPSPIGVLLDALLGLFCHVTWCDIDVCGEKGICNLTSNGWICDCFSGYGGSRCELILTPCTPNPCGEHGNCSIRNGTFFCQCGLDYAEINRRFVYAMRTIGQGHAAMTTFCGVMDFPPPVAEKSYNNIINKLQLCRKEVAEASMQSAALEER